MSRHSKSYSYDSDSWATAFAVMGVVIRCALVAFVAYQVHVSYHMPYIISVPIACVMIVLGIVMPV